MRKKKLKQVSIAVILILLLIIVGWTLIRSSTLMTDNTSQDNGSHDHDHDHADAFFNHTLFEIGRTT